MSKLFLLDQVDESLSETILNHISNTIDALENDQNEKGLDMLLNLQSDMTALITMENSTK